MALQSPPEGWRTDRDNWLTRERRPNDARPSWWATIERQNHGWCTKTHVFARDAKAAADFDAAATTSA